MTSRALESEVELLNSEVTRLRLMVQRCNVAQQELGQKVRQAYANEGDVAGGGGVVATQQAAPTIPHPARIPQPDDPISVLPSLFSGMDGTARLFKVLLETYPWLLPADLREAQEELERKKETSRYKKKSSSRNPTPRQRRSKKRSPSTSSDSSSSSEESSNSEEELPKSSGRSKQQKPVSPKPTAAAVVDETSTTPPLKDSPRIGGGYDGGGVGTGSISPRSSSGIFGTGTGAVLGFGRRSPGRQSPSSSSPAMSPTATYTPLPKAHTTKKTSILNKIKHLGEDDEDGSSSDGDGKMYAPSHKRRATSAPSDDTSDKNSFVDETMKPANEEDEHDF